MSDGSNHLEVLAQVLLDGFCLGGRFNDDEILAHGSQKNVTAVPMAAALSYIYGRHPEVTSINAERQTVPRIRDLPCVGTPVPGRVG